LEESPLLKAVRDACTYSRVILMHIDTLELHYLAI
jgi:hypothetical protein